MIEQHAASISESKEKLDMVLQRCARGGRPVADIGAVRGQRNRVGAARLPGENRNPHLDTLILLERAGAADQLCGPLPGPAAAPRHAQRHVIATVMSGLHRHRTRRGRPWAGSHTSAEHNADKHQDDDTL